MRIIPDQLKSRNLVPFKRRPGKYKIPGMASENHALIDRVDADLSAEEQTYVRHYLGYADALIRSAEENAGAGSSESQENARSAQTPGEGPAAGRVNEGNPATKHHPIKVA